MKNIRKIIFRSLFLLYIVISQSLLNGRPIYDIEGNRKVMDSSAGVMDSVKE